MPAASRTCSTSSTSSTAAVKHVPLHGRNHSSNKLNLIVMHRGKKKLAGQVWGVRVECYAVSPLEAEAKAIMWAMTHARNRNFQNVVFESDSLSLVNALRNRSTLRQRACLFSQILDTSLAFSTCNWSFVKRDGNMVAHSIATWGIGCNDEIVLEGRVPNCSLDRVTNDVLLSRD
ncbi:hypothetical protein CTI12_AA102250 [Artemisia annua]|uniref:RNase H type-1 domain-containing protein n=1 Tax=Artemisia annua TaxID=35608 RepID=A0A2U1PWN1_ARTAN|nr:hypothetical protein CTI12_AA102250 [Artemisia annua]